MNFLNFPGLDGAGGAGGIGDFFLNVFFKKFANFPTIPGLDGGGGGNAGGGIAAAGGRNRGGNIIGRGGSGAGFKDGSNLYLYSCNFPELMRSRYCFKSGKESPCFLNVLICPGVLRRLKSVLG